MVVVNNILKFLDDKIIFKHNKLIVFFSIIIFLILTTNHQLSYLNMGYDYFLQSLSAISLTEGHGFSIPIISDNNINNVVYERNGFWPIGYSLLAAPILYFTNNDAILTYRILFIISTTLLIIVSLKLFNKLKIYLYKKYIFITIGYWAINYFPFKNIGVSDIFSLTFFIYGTLLCIKLLNKNIHSIKITHLIILGVVSFLPAFFRFAYYPICIIIPLFITYFSFKNKPLLYKSFVISFTTIFLIASQIIFMKIYFSSGKSIGDALNVKQQLFYFSNLKGYDAIFFNAFIDDSIISRLIPLNNYPYLLFILSALIALVVLGGLWLIAKYLLKKLDKHSPLYIALFLLSAGSIATILFLSFISVWYPSFELTGEIQVRTWVSFSRYHALPLYFFQLIIFIAILSKKEISNKFIKLLSILIFVVSLGINGYYWLIHEYKFKLYQPSEEMADAQAVIDYLTKKGIQGNIKYINSKKNTENEFLENNFSGMLALKGIYQINFYKINPEIIHKSTSNFIITVNPNNDSIIYHLNAWKVNFDIDTINYSNYLNKYTLHLSHK